METVNGAMTADQKYFGYSTQRDNGKVATDHRFTGQKEDGSGLQFYDVRYAVEPDHLSTDQTKLLTTILLLTNYETIKAKYLLGDY